MKEGSNANGQYIPSLGSAVAGFVASRNDTVPICTLSTILRPSSFPYTYTAMACSSISNILQSENRVLYFRVGISKNDETTNTTTYLVLLKSATKFANSECTNKRQLRQEDKKTRCMAKETLCDYSRQSC